MRIAADERETSIYLVFWFRNNIIRIGMTLWMNVIYAVMVIMDIRSFVYFHRKHSAECREYSTHTKDMNMERMIICYVLNPKRLPVNFVCDT